ncbi:spermidine synthase [Striga asiatica]|uniref:Spermidine synthase n=1 Tax=Striga asiatica TaxID=4170 RepID=A0A5A7Q6C9_STRAF|nr:spermidine synthase [Striga asiatica]
MQLPQQNFSATAARGSTTKSFFTPALFFENLQSLDVVDLDGGLLRHEIHAALALLLRFPNSVSNLSNCVNSITNSAYNLPLGISDLNELFTSERRTRLVPKDRNLRPTEFLLRSRSSRGGKPPRSGAVPLRRLSVRTRSSRDLKRLILGGGEPHCLRETRDNFCKLDSLVRTVKELIENFSESAPPQMESFDGERFRIHNDRFPTGDGRRGRQSRQSLSTF